MSRVRPCPLRGAAALAALVLLAACGYSTRRLADLPAGARTIAVRTFENQGFRRDLELRLTQAVVEEIRARSSYAIGSLAGADLVLSGVMTAEESVVTQDADRNAVQKRLGGTLDVVITDRRTGAVVKRYRASASTEFTPDLRGESLEGSATDEWARRIAERVVQGFERGL